jgi:prepilin-type N-terminal cleavage/methylation domain-containing protein
MKRNGLTFVEFLITVVIAAILLAVVFPYTPLEVSIESQIEGDNYIAKLLSPDLSCETRGCIRHVTIVPKEGQGPKEKEGLGEIYVFACNIATRENPTPDDLIDVFNKRYAPVGHPLRALTWEQVQKIYEDLRAKEKAGEKVVAVEAEKK